MQQQPNPGIFHNNSNVTYAYGGGLPSAKQGPPATSGSLPSRQPPVQSMNGYGQHQYGQPGGYHNQAPPMNGGYQNSTGSTGSGNPPQMAPQFNNQQPPVSRMGMMSLNSNNPPPNTGYNSQMQPNAPPSSGYNNQPPPMSNMNRAPNTGMPPPLSQPGMQSPMSQPTMQPPMSQPGMPPMSQPGMPPMSQPGMPPMSQPGMQPPISQPGRPPMPSQPGMSSMPPLPGQQPGMPPQQPGGPPTLQPGMPGQQPGQPPMPGMMPSAPGGRPSAYPSQPQQPAAKRLDPDAMPSPIQVIEDDKTNRTNEVFRTEGKGLVPPLVTTNFTVEDMGSASPRFIRCTTYNLPTTNDMSKTCQVPMALSIKPMATLKEGEYPPLVVDPGADGPIRCKRCKAYMCPQFMFIDGGRRFQCHLCNAITDTPHYYFDHIDHTNQRVDKYHKPELCRGSFEYIATKDYCRNDKFPNSPAFIFAIDVSYNAIKSGYVTLLCRNLLNLLENLPRDYGQEKSTIKVGFFTYSNVLHFYNLKSSLAQPQMMVVSDVNDVFVPLQDGFLVDLDESRHVITSLLEQIPEMFRDSRETELVFAPVVQATIQALKSSQRAGKLFMFHTSLPIAEAPGKLKNRDDRKLIGTDKEKVLFTPASNVYDKLGKECAENSCSVDLFLFPTQYIDIATLGKVSLMSGGTIYKYSMFRSEIDGERFIKDLSHDISRDIVFDAILRIRTSTGIRAVDFTGALNMNNTTDVELAAVDCDKSITVEIKHDDKIQEEYGAFVQAALLYTSVGGQRRLRLHNLNLSVCSQLADLYRCCETDVIMNFFAKKAVKAGLETTTSRIREDFIAQLSTTLAAYRKHCAAPSSPGQLILPECMKLIPIYLNCLLKNDAIHSAHDISTDDRAYLRQLILSMDVRQSQTFFYPRLTPVTFGKAEKEGMLPRSVRCSEERLKPTDAYLLDNTISLFLWIGQAINPEWLQNVFGVSNLGQVDVDNAHNLKNLLMAYDNDDSKYLLSLIEQIQAERKGREMKLVIIRQRDKLEPWFKHFLVEDRGLGGSASYVDFLCHMHKEIRSLLS